MSEGEIQSQSCAPVVYVQMLRRRQKREASWAKGRLKGMHSEIYAKEPATVTNAGQ